MLMTILPICSNMKTRLRTIEMIDLEYFKDWWLHFKVFVWIMSPLMQFTLEIKPNSVFFLIIQNSR